MINDILEKYLPEDAGFANGLKEAMDYSLMIGGKRIRPILMNEAYKLFGGNDAGAIEPFMCAIEMIHTYSLVHDDLPAMDADELRRGVPTTWKKFGEANGILAGDALLTFAFETAAKSSADSDRVIRAISVLSNKAGIFGMCGGQSVDVNMTGKDIPKDMLRFIYENKTGALIEASLMIGAILAGANDADVKRMENVASNIGLAFQIRDDILDIISTEEELGKPIGSDENSGKNTYALIYGVEAAQKQVEKLTGEAVDLLNEIDGEKQFFIDFINSLEKRNS